MSRLRVVVRIETMVVPVNAAGDRAVALAIRRIFGRAAEAVRLVVRPGPGIAIDPHRAVAAVRVNGSLPPVDRERAIVHPESVTMRVRVRVQARLQHLLPRPATSLPDVSPL